MKTPKNASSADHSLESSFTLNSNLKYMVVLIKINLLKYQQERSSNEYLKMAFSSCRDFIYLAQYFRNPVNIVEKGLHLLDKILLEIE